MALTTQPSAWEMFLMLPIKTRFLHCVRHSHLQDSQEPGQGRVPPDGSLVLWGILPQLKKGCTGREGPYA